MTTCVVGISAINVIRFVDSQKFYQYHWAVYDWLNVLHIGHHKPTEEEGDLEIPGNQEM